MGGCPAQLAHRGAGRSQLPATAERAQGLPGEPGLGSRARAASSGGAHWDPQEAEASTGSRAGDHRQSYVPRQPPAVPSRWPLTPIQGPPVGGDKPEPCLARGSVFPADPGSALHLTTPPNPEAASAVSAKISFVFPHPHPHFSGERLGIGPTTPPPPLPVT